MLSPHTVYALRFVDIKMVWASLYFIKNWTHLRWLNVLFSRRSMVKWLHSTIWKQCSLLYENFTGTFSVMPVSLHLNIYWLIQNESFRFFYFMKNRLCWYYFYFYNIIFWLESQLSPSPNCLFLQSSALEERMYVGTPIVVEAKLTRGTDVHLY